MDNVTNIAVTVGNSTIGCNTGPVSTSLTTKIVYSLWIFAIYFTFPGTNSTQPAVTTQTFGQKYGGFIYAFIFSSDIVNNLMVAAMSKVDTFNWHLLLLPCLFNCQEIKRRFGWFGLFLIVSAWGFVALIATLFYPYRPR